MSANRIINEANGLSIPFGGPTYDDFTPPNATRSTVKLTQLLIGHGEFVHCLELDWSDGTSKCFGSRMETLELFLLGEDEIITQVNIVEKSTYICAGLRLCTNLGQDKVFGSLVGGAVHKYIARDGIEARIADRMGLLSFRIAGSAMRPVFAEHQHVTNTTLKYEVITDTTSARGSGRQPPETAFTRVLLSSTITLTVGPDHSTLYAPAATLCLLPFFHAAINGGFQEAALKAITLPEDSVAAISALVEFLATGAYSYAFHTTTEDAQRPPCRADEAVFHVGVYVIADKYDCEGLATAAKRNFREVMQDVMGQDVGKAWIVAYEAGMRVYGNWGASDVEAVDKRVIRQIKKMIVCNHNEVERAVKEIPDFGMDLLKIAVSIACKD